MKKRNICPKTGKIIPTRSEKSEYQFVLTKSEKSLVDFIRKYKITPDDDFRTLIAMFYIGNIDNEMICAWIKGNRKK